MTWGKLKSKELSTRIFSFSEAEMDLSASIFSYLRLASGALVLT